MENPRAGKIAQLNDRLRKTLTGGLVVLTPGVREAPNCGLIIEAVRSYEFDGIDGNNPYGENDFGAVEVEGEKYFFKIDYLDLELERHSRDPSDSAVTRRVLTIMRAEEY